MIELRYSSLPFLLISLAPSMSPAQTRLDSAKQTLLTATWDSAAARLPPSLLRDSPVLCIESSITFLKQAQPDGPLLVPESTIPDTSAATHLAVRGLPARTATQCWAENPESTPPNLLIRGSLAFYTTSRGDSVFAATFDGYLTAACGTYNSARYCDQPLRDSPTLTLAGLAGKVGAIWRVPRLNVTERQH